MMGYTETSNLRSMADLSIRDAMKGLQYVQKPEKVIILEGRGRVQCVALPIDQLIR